MARRVFEMPVWRLRSGAVATVVAAGLLCGSAYAAASPTGTARPEEAGANHLFGDYLAGWHAQQVREFPAAAAWFEKAIATDPNSPELVSRAFLMEVSTGSFERARALSEAELKLDPNDAVAELVLTIDRLKAGDTAGAMKHATALPQDGLYRFASPLVLAWTRMATGDVAQADAALQGLDKFNGFAPLKYFQLGLLYDFAGNPA